MSGTGVPDSRVSSPQLPATPAAPEAAGVVASAAPGPQGLPRAARVRAKAEFDAVFARGRRIGHPLLALHVLADARPARLGLAVSRKVDRHAHGRNRIKRALREGFRRQRAHLPPGAYVVVARGPAAQAAGDALRAALDAVLQRAGALPVPRPAGTMPAPPSPPPALP